MLVNVWLDHHPQSVQPFPAYAIKHLGTDIDVSCCAEDDDTINTPDDAMAPLDDETHGGDGHSRRHVLLPDAYRELHVGRSSPAHDACEYAVEQCTSVVRHLEAKDI